MPQRKQQPNLNRNELLWKNKQSKSKLNSKPNMSKLKLLRRKKPRKKLASLKFKRSKPSMLLARQHWSS